MITLMLIKSYIDQEQLTGIFNNLRSGSDGEKVNAHYDVYRYVRHISESLAADGILLSNAEILKIIKEQNNYTDDITFTGTFIKEVIFYENAMKRFKIDAIKEQQ
jgi:hypothetical protein